MCGAKESDDREVASFLWCLYTAGPRSVPLPPSHFLFPPSPFLLPLYVSVFLFFSGVNHESESCVVDGPFSLVVAEKEGEMRYWFESLWEENNRSLTEATRKHKHHPAASQCRPDTREEELKSSFAFCCSISLHLQLIVDCPEGRNDEGGGRRRRRRPGLGTPRVPADPLAARAGTPNPLNLPCAERLWANRTNARGLELWHPEGRWFKSNTWTPEGMLNFSLHVNPAHPSSPRLPSPHQHPPTTSLAHEFCPESDKSSRLWLIHGRAEGSAHDVIAKSTREVSDIITRRQQEHLFCLFGLWACCPAKRNTRHYYSLLIIRHAGVRYSDGVWEGVSSCNYWCDSNKSIVYNHCKNVLKVIGHLISKGRPWFLTICWVELINKSLISVFYGNRSEQQLFTQLACV